MSDAPADQSTDLLVEERGRVLVLTMNRPEAKNAMSMAMAHQIADALQMFDSRADLSVAVITGAGGTFCAGMDLKGFARGERPVVEGRGYQIQAETVDQRERQVAVRDGGPEGTLLRSAFDVDVDPLVVAGELRELVDHLLGDLAPLPRPDLLADERAQPLDSLDLGQRHARSV